jgi:putative transposase
MNRVVQDHGGILFEAGGVSDHVHLYLECPKDVSISSLANLIKTNSTKWIRDTFRSSQNFHWQSGYSAFSVDARNDRRLRDYIRNQELHHAKISFDSEYKRFLEEYAIDHDERYVLG